MRGQGRSPVRFGGWLSVPVLWCGKISDGGRCREGASTARTGTLATVCACACACGSVCESARTCVALAGKPERAQWVRMEVMDLCSPVDAGPDVALIVFASVFCAFLAADSWIAGVAVHRARWHAAPQGG